MKALIDTCIIIDVLQSRKPFNKSAENLFLAVANNLFSGYITAKSTTDIYYLMHRYTHDDKTSRETLNKLFSLFNLLDSKRIDCQNAVFSPVSDYEDAVMVETAVHNEMDCIVTRNLKDYEKSSIPVYSPESFLKKLSDNLT